MQDVQDTHPEEGSWDSPADDSSRSSGLGDSVDPDGVSVIPAGVEWSQGSRRRFSPISQIGRGGFASVYKAYDHKLNRLVALKIPHQALAGDQRVRRILRREGQAMAQMRHSNLVTLYDLVIDEDEGYLINELITGPSLSVWLRDFPAGCSQRIAANIIQRIAAALTQAHSQGILHRDIKPSNILLDTLTVDEPLEFRPRLSDFGLARLINDETISRTIESVIGTTHYIPPEVLKSSGESHSVASDIYSLSTVLYQLLTGKQAFAGTTQAEIFNRIIHGDFVRPRKLNPRISKDLEAICLRGMNLNSKKRYASSADLADDLTRYLEHRPVIARRPSMAGSVRKAIVRYPTLAIASALIITITAIFFGLQSSAYNRLNKLNEEIASRNSELEAALAAAERQRFNNEQLIYSEDMIAASKDLLNGDLRRVRETLGRYREGTPLEIHRDYEWYDLTAAIRRDFQLLWSSPAALYCQDFTQDGQWMAVAGADSHITVLSSQTGEVARRWPTGQQEINDVVILDDQDLIYSSGDDGSIHCYQFSSMKLLWNIDLFPMDKAFNIFHLQELNRLVVLSNQGLLGVIDLESNEQVPDWPQPEKKVNIIQAVPGTNLLLVGCYGSMLELWDMEKKEKLASQKLGVDRDGAISGFAVDSERGFVSCFTLESELYLLDFPSFTLLDQMDLKDELTSLMYDSDSGYFLAIERPGVFHQLRITEERTYESVDQWMDTESRYFAIDSPPETTSAFTVGGDGLVRRWNLIAGRKTDLVYETLKEEVTVLFTPMNDDADKSFVWFASADGIDILDDETLQRRRLIAGDFRSGAICHLVSDQYAIAAPLQPMAVYQLELTNEQLPLAKLSPKDIFGSRISAAKLGGPVMTASGDGEWLAGCDFAGRRVWIQKLDAHATVASFSAVNPLAVAIVGNAEKIYWGDANELKAWYPTETGIPEVVASGGGQEVHALKLSRDQQKMAFLVYDRNVKILSTETDLQIGATLVHPYFVEDACFTSSGNSLLTIDRPGTLRCWNLASGKQTLEQSYGEGGNGGGNVCRISGNAEYVSNSTNDGLTRVFRLRNPTIE